MEVNGRIYGQKFSFTAKQSRKMISDRISGDIPTRMKRLKMVIPILMHFCNFGSN